MVPDGIPQPPITHNMLELSAIIPEFRFFIGPSLGLSGWSCLHCMVVVSSSHRASVYDRPVHPPYENSLLPIDVQAEPSSPGGFGPVVDSWVHLVVLVLKVSTWDFRGNVLSPLNDCWKPW